MDVLLNRYLPPPVYSETGLICGRPAQTPEELLAWENATEIAFTNLARPQTQRQPRRWNVCMKRYFCKFACGAADCNPISACTVPRHPVSKHDRPRWFVVFAPSTSVANMTIPYEFSTTPEYRQKTPFKTFVGVKQLSHAERAFVEIAHPSVAAHAKLGFTTLGDKDLSKAYLPLEYPPMMVLDTYSFEEHERCQRAFEEYWRTTSIIAKTECPTRLDLRRLDRHILANTAYRASLSNLTRYSDLLDTNIENEKNPMARPRRLRPMRQYAGQLRTIDLFRLLKKFDTEEGRKKLESYEQGSLPWLIARLLRATASRFGSLIGYGHAHEQRSLDLTCVWEKEIQEKILDILEAEGERQEATTNLEALVKGILRQSDMTVAEIQASMAALVDHENRFTGNPMTRWGNKTEEPLRNVAILRLRSYEKHVNGYEGPIEVENVGIETIPGHPFLGVSTDGNLLFGKSIPKAFEFKNPTFFVPGIKSEYAMQMMLICAVRGITNIVFCVGKPLFAAMMRYDFCPEHMEQVYFPRLWHNHLYFYLEAFLYSFNYRCMPPWLPRVLKQKESTDDPEKLYAADLAKLELVKGTYAIPAPEESRAYIGYGPDGENRLWQVQHAGHSPPPPPLRMDEIDETWRPEMIHSGYFSTIPYTHNQLSELNADGDPNQTNKRMFSTMTAASSSSGMDIDMERQPKKRKSDTLD